MSKLRKYINKITIASALLFACLIGIFTITSKAETQTSDFGTSYEITPPNNEYGNSHINSIGGMSYKSENLLYNLGSTQEKSGLSFTISNGSINIEGTPEADYVGVSISNYFPNGLNGTYTLKNFSNDNNQVFFRITYVKEGIRRYNWNVGGTNKSSQITFDGTETLFTLEYAFQNPTHVYIYENITPMVVKGNTIPTEFQQYFEGIRDSAVTSVVCKDSNNNVIDTLNIPQEIQNLDGYGWGLNYNCSNTIDFINNKFIQKVGRVVLNGSENGWVYNATYQVATLNNLSLISYINTDNYLISSNKYEKRSANGWTQTFSNIAIMYVENGIRIDIKDISFDNLDDFKNYLSNNNLTVYYELATPVETDISSYIESYELNYVSGTTITFENEYENAVPYWVVYYGEPISNLYTNYNTLQQQYETLQQNYNTLNEQYTGLQNAFNNLESAFNTYVSNHSHTNQEWNTLNENYSNLQERYYDLQEDYNELEEKYNELLRQSTTSMYYALNGASAKLYDRYTNNILAQDTIIIDEKSMVFDLNSIPNIADYCGNYDSEDTTTYPTTRCYLIIDLNLVINNSILFTFDNTILDTNVNLNNTINNTSYGYTRNSELNPYQLVVNEERNSYNQIKYDGYYLPDYYGINFNITLDGYSYSLGYQKGVDSQQDTITILQNEINRITTQKNTIQAQYEELQERYNELSQNDNSLYGMIIAIADTPLKIFKQIFNFDVLGINIAGVVLSLISLLVIIWLIKKLI